MGLGSAYDVKVKMLRLKLQAVGLGSAYDVKVGIPGFLMISYGIYVSQE
jgi:hypothetical protein